MIPALRVLSLVLATTLVVTALLPCASGEGPDGAERVAAAHHHGADRHGHEVHAAEDVPLSPCGHPLPRPTSWRAACPCGCDAPAGPGAGSVLRLERSVPSGVLAWAPPLVREPIVPIRLVLPTAPAVAIDVVPIPA